MTVGYASGKTVHKYSAEPVGPLAMPFTAPAARLLSSPDAQDCAATAEIVFEVPEGARHARIAIWDRFARPARILLDQAAPSPGLQRAVWDFTGEDGHALSCKEFIYRVTVDDRSESGLLRRER